MPLRQFPEWGSQELDRGLAGITPGKGARPDFFLTWLKPGKPEEFLRVVHFAPMLLRQFLRVPLAALLLAAFLMQALLPAWAAARTQSQARWIEVCSVSGLQWIKADQPQDSVSHAAADHCVLCAASGAVPGFDISPYLHAGLSDASPAAVASPLIITFPGHALHSRAPPSFS